MIIHKGKNYNGELSLINSEEKSYLLGFLYSDGFVCKNTNTVVLQLHGKDGYLLEELQKKFPFFSLLKDNITNKISLRKTNPKLKLDILKLGVFPLKSTITKNLLHIPKINELFIRDFIRGYFDGNGGCTLSTSGGFTQKRVYIYSASNTLINEIKFLLLEIGIKCTVKTQVTDHYDLMYKLEISTNSYFDFYKYLYEDSILSLIRKKDKFDKILQTNFFIPKETKSCPKCGNENTVCNGKYKYKDILKQRYLCKLCNINFY